MKIAFTYHNRRWPIVPSLLLGPVMWRCRNGAPNYATEWRLHLDTRENCISGRWFLLPALELQQWQRSVLASDRNLGTVYHSISLTLHFLRWEVEVCVGRARHNKDQEQVDLVCKRLGIR